MNLILSAGPGNDWLPILFVMIAVVGVWFGVEFLVVRVRAWWRGRTSH